MKKLLAIAALGLPMLASAQVNAGFETGDFTGWTVSQGGGIELAQVINYGGTVYGEPVPAAPGGGQFGLYFVEDNQLQTVSQTTTNAAGLYNWSIQYYLPANGFANPFDGAITLTLDGVNVWHAQLSTLTPTTWGTVSGQINLPANYNITLTFDADGRTGKDIIVDSITVTAVPEPESFALMVAGLAAVGFLARRRRA